MRERWHVLSNYKAIGSKGRWRSGESAHLPPMWPGFKSQRRRHMWVEFVVGSLLCSERFFSGYSGFPLSSETSISKFQFDHESGRRRTTLWMRYLQIIIYLFIYLFILLQGMTRTVLLHYPISGEIRTVDSQSDLRILLWLWLIEKDLVRIIQLKHSPFSPRP